KLRDPLQPNRSLSVLLAPTPQWSSEQLVEQLWAVVQARGAVEMVLQHRDGQPALLVADKVGVPVFVVVHPDREPVEYVALANLVDYVTDLGADVSSDLATAWIEKLSDTQAWPTVYGQERLPRFGAAAEDPRPPMPSRKRKAETDESDETDETGETGTAQPSKRKRRRIVARPVRYAVEQNEAL